MTAPLTPDTLNTIRKNAGKFPPATIAEALGWSLARLERAARERQIDLNHKALGPTPVPIPAPRSVEPAAPEAAPIVPEGDEPRRRKPRRSAQHAVRLYPAEMRLFKDCAAAHGLSVGAAFARLIGNARDREMIHELLRLPAPMPKGGEGE